MWGHGTSPFRYTRCTYGILSRDTVSSVGFARGPMLPETITGMCHVCGFRHALSLDELRLKFLPEYANGGRGRLRNDIGNVKEVWFVGSHSDMCVSLRLAPNAS